MNTQTLLGEGEVNLLDETPEHARLLRLRLRRSCLMKTWSASVASTDPGLIALPDSDPI